MNFKFKTFLLIIVCWASQGAFGQYKIREPAAIPLHGEWLFALDPAEMGVTGKWFMEKVAQSNRLDKVTVPHCFSSDPRFEHYTGTAWYRKTFSWKPVTGKRVILHFDAAYYKTHVWLNNEKVGEHEGGYTPFSFDVTDLLKDGDNLLAVSVNNDTWKPGTVPGAKDNGNINDPFMGWLNYGGLIRPVYLTIEPEVYVENLKIDALPDLVKGTAVLKTKIRFRNASKSAISPKISYNVTFNGKTVPVNIKGKSESIPAGQMGLVESEGTLTAAQVKLWDLDEPNLYQLKVAVGEDSVSSHFGIRKVEVKNAQLHLNGKSIRVGGGNRVVDYPGLGSVEPDWLIEKDFKLMKEAGMEFQRLTHYTPSEYFYDLADKYGMLIITEAGNWQLTPNQMDNDSIRKKFRSQFTEMAERDWNHPSVIAYSVGNEYQSTTPAGQSWTKDMIAFARQTDPTRLYTFATMLLNTLPKKPEDEASQYVDFISTNTYGNHAKVLDHIHTLYPEKPILVSEWGVRADAKDEAFQAKHIADLMVEFRKRPYIVGASWWTYNDYQSRHHGTNVNGYRPWGIVGPDRSFRAAYGVHQNEYSPVTIEKVSFKTGGQGQHLLTVRLTVRGDFPSRAIKGYKLKTNGTTLTLPDLNPGESKEIDIPVAGFDKQLHITISKPTGFTAIETDIELK
ncbi:glycoside hydrolase family 2 protein [Dyadobacter fanqingshengii]|uniref:Beta galactosidase jelly roll domain-containing protein n=1 Tax=Dyadobacter fanqingshengii TaxID=2906443 RepID=A0A9X1PEQ5_9BACT|nr:glycoside hydrolase family 2 TIM barrel-domain containing protein [Dyadobacter fanqingshengii]MCF0042764.1 beta galactosidase jelly roll domain-containing protein [Dyadobacter fanqingshengii]USJ36014.1 beta galactosidase jelly roll domain-containing protein [Dyadobacter fanqingshengii]